MNWKDLSFFYLLAMCRYGKTIKGTKRAIHPDTITMYAWIEKYLTKYGEYPGIKQFCHRYNIEPRQYWQKGWTPKSIADELKLHKAKADIEETQAKMQEKLLDDEATVQDLMEPLSELLNGMLKMTDTKPLRLSQYNKVIKYFRDMDSSKKLKFGFPALDKLTGGIGPKDFVLLYANTSQGKSTFGRLFAYNIAAQGHTVLYVTLEEDGYKSVAKTFSVGAQIDSKTILEQRALPKDIKKVKTTMQDLKGDIVFIDKLESRSTAELHTVCQEHKPAIIIIDQLSHWLPNGDFDWKVVNATCKQLQAYVQNHDTPMLLLHQGAMHQSKVRTAWGTGPEQDADISLYLNNTETNENGEKIKRLDIKKNRDGEKDVSINYLFELKRGLVAELGIVRNPTVVTNDSSLDDEYRTASPVF